MEWGVARRGPAQGQSPMRGNRANDLREPDKNEVRPIAAARTPERPRERVRQAFSRDACTFARLATSATFNKGKESSQTLADRSHRGAERLDAGEEH